MRKGQSVGGMRGTTKPSGELEELDVEDGAEGGLGAERGDSKIELLEEPEDMVMENVQKGEG